jgi:5'(3')-deoxyribonucleotidase
MTRPSSEMTGERTVLVDMDGVVADFETPNDRIVSAFGLSPVTERPDFYYADTYQNYPELVDTIYQENRRPGFFRAFPLVDGALSGWQRILDADFIPRICSSPLENHPTVISEKREWLEEYFVPAFGAWVIDTAIFNRDKSGYDACAMIDDRPTLRNIEGASWQHIVFSRSYNAKVETVFRLNGWNDPSLESLLAKCRGCYLTRR